MRQGRRIERAVIACVALYALVLQALLTAALPCKPPLAPDNVICAQDGTSQDGPGPGPGGHGGDCALACGMCHTCAPAAGLAAGKLAAPRVVPAQAAWSKASGLLAQPPPTHHVSPRGPPLA